MVDQVELRTFYFETQETIRREAEVTAHSLTEARRLMREYVSGKGYADMGGDAPIQLGDMESVKMTFRLSPHPNNTGEV